MCIMQDNTVQDNMTAPLADPLSRSGDVIHPQLWESGSGYAGYPDPNNYTRTIGSARLTSMSAKKLKAGMN